MLFNFTIIIKIINTHLINVVCVQNALRKRSSLGKKKCKTEFLLSRSLQLSDTGLLPLISYTEEIGGVV